jgi:hypothetical protein
MANRKKEERCSFFCFRETDGLVQRALVLGAPSTNRPAHRLLVSTTNTTQEHAASHKKTLCC